MGRAFPPGHGEGQLSNKSLCWALSDKQEQLSHLLETQPQSVLTAPFLVTLALLDQWPQPGPSDSKLPGPLETTWAQPLP